MCLFTSGVKWIIFCFTFCLQETHNRTWFLLVVVALRKLFSLLAMDTISAVIHTSFAMSSQSLSVCLEDYVHFQDHQIRYVCTAVFLKYDTLVWWWWWWHMHGRTLLVTKVRGPTFLECAITFYIMFKLIPWNIDFRFLILRFSRIFCSFLVTPATAACM